MRNILCIIILSCSINMFASNSIKGKRIPSTIISCNISIGNNCNYSDKLTITQDMVYGISIDGELSILQEDYLVRVIVKGKNGSKHLIMESYREIQGNIPSRFKDYSEETFLTDGLFLDSIIVYTRGASLLINGFRYLTNNQAIGTKKEIEVLVKEKRDSIIKCNIEKINEYNEKHNLLWRADKTWLSQQNYETKNNILGVKDDCSTRGIEYYAGGIIEIDNQEQNYQLTRTDTTYVDNFDWRNRHGRNWMTSIKNQGNSKCCFLFACVGAVEALTNMYFNQKLDLDLSEQELVSCSGLSDPYTNGTPSDRMELPLNYLVNHGICDEQSYPFVYSPNQQCLSWLINSNEQISISGYNEVTKNENEIKSAIINHGPLVSGIRSVVWMNHSMVLVGYGVLQPGDTIYHHLGYNYNTNTYFHDKFFTVQENDPRIGRTYLVYKNSYGLMDNDSNLGYMYVIHNNYNTSLPITFYLETPISSLNYSTTDVILEDADGDGYFYWGIGPKPTSCPSWVPDAPDGDDSDYDLGPMNSYGYIENLHDRANPAFIVGNTITYNTRKYLYTNYYICDEGELIISNIVDLYGDVVIRIGSGGTLTIDGGTLNNASFILESGSTLNIVNGGTINMRQGSSFDAPIGAKINVINGEIISNN